MICDYQTNKVYWAEGIKGYPKVAENLLCALYKEGIEKSSLPSRNGAKAGRAQVQRFRYDNHEGLRFVLN